MLDQSWDTSPSPSGRMTDVSSNMQTYILHLVCMICKLLNLDPEKNPWFKYRMRKYDLTATHVWQRAVASLQPRTPTEVSSNELGAGQGYLLQAEVDSLYSIQQALHLEVSGLGETKGAQRLEEVCVNNSVKTSTCLEHENSNVTCYLSLD